MGEYNVFKKLAICLSAAFNLACSQDSRPEPAPLTPAETAQLTQRQNIRNMLADGIKLRPEEIEQQDRDLAKKRLELECARNKDAVTGRHYGSMRETCAAFKETPKPF